MRLAGLLLVSTALVGGAAVLSARAPEPPLREPAQDEDYPLEEHMEELNASLRKLRRGLADASKKAEMIDELQKAQVAALAAKAEVPVRATKLEGEAKAGFLTGYRREMVRVLEHLLGMEAAVLDGDSARAAELMEGLMALKKSGHEAYQQDW